MGQKIKCSYKIPEAFEGEHSMEIDGAFSESREHTLSLSLEIETNMPVFNNRTIMSATDIIVKPVNKVDPQYEIASSDN